VDTTEEAVAVGFSTATSWNNVNLNEEENALTYLQFVFHDLLEKEAIVDLWNENETLGEEVETRLVSTINKGFEILNEIWKDVYYDEDPTQTGETNGLLDTLEKGDVLRGHGCEICIRFDEKGTSYVEIIEKPEGYKLSSGVLTNGIPAECIPENVCWDGKKWYCRDDDHDQYDSGSDENSEESLREIEESTDERVILSMMKTYPCYSAEILYTEEYYKILEAARIKQSELDTDLERRMRVIRWIHQINLSVADRWNGRQLGEADILESSVWEEMGRMLRVEEDTWEAGEEDRSVETEVTEVSDEVDTDHTRSTKLLL